MTEETDYGQSGIPLGIDNRMLWVPTCNRCGALVMNRDIHDKWHRSQHVAQAAVVTGRSL